MALQCGIVGLPNVGKSTLFNCLSNAKAQSANFPFCTIDPNIGSTNVPDTYNYILMYNNLHDNESVEQGFLQFLNTYHL